MAELRITGQLADLSDNVRISVDKQVSEFRNPLKKTGTYSYSISLPKTQKNCRLFGFESDKQKLGKFRRSYPASLSVDDNTIIDGEFILLKITASAFEGAIGTARVSNIKLGDLLADKSLRDIKSFTPLDFDGDATVIEYIGRDLEYRPSGNPSTRRSELCFASVADSFYALTHSKQVSYEDLGISHFCGAILEKILQDAGYSVSGNVLNSDVYRKLILLYSDGANTQLWNYGKLAPMTSVAPPTFASFGDSFEFRVVHRYERQGDYVYVMEYPFSAESGDLCYSLGRDGVYTAKYTGLYTIRVRGESAVARLSGGAVTHQAFTALRELGDNQFIPVNDLPSVADFSNAAVEYLDFGTLAVGNATSQVKLIEGKQYAVQRYISVPKSAGAPETYNLYNPNAGAFSITSCDGPLLVNPALFLPDMKQTEFVNAIFKLFNLYYQTNEDTKTITLYTRDEFFQRTSTTIVDLSNHLDLEACSESPLTDKEIADTYYRFKDDPADYLLKRTDYLALVNGEQDEASYELPFAPLAFMQVAYKLYDLSPIQLVAEGFDFIPAIIPDDETEGLALLEDPDKFTSAGGWVPRICLYHGTKVLKSSTYSTGLFGYVNPHLNLRGTTLAPPKLGFFDVTHQPHYKIVENVARRSFSIEAATEATIYNPIDADFVRSNAVVNGASLAVNLDNGVNPRGMFFNLYANDLLIANLSNYLEGVGRMNAVLFNTLTGRQILRIGTDLFLLEGIRGYDLGSNKAQYRIYRLVAGAVSNLIAGDEDTPPNNESFFATASHTASCLPGYAGSSVTKTVTVESNVSQEEADRLAAEAAQQEAEDALICQLEYTSTQTYTAECPGGYVGSSVTKTYTYVSLVSQDDADLYALTYAQLEAEAELVCELEDTGGGGGSYTNDDYDPDSYRPDWYEGF